MGEQIIATCAGGVHKLEISELFPLLADTAQLKQDEVRDFAKRSLVAFRQRGPAPL